MATLLSSIEYADNQDLSRNYIASRKSCADLLSADLATGNHPYFNIKELGNGQKEINGIRCADWICAMAFILARWW